MILVAGGDSFIYGSELQSPNSAFTALLSENYNYQCVAWPGIGNDGITRRVVAKVESLLPEKLCVIVSWTFPGRYEFKFAYDTGQRTQNWYSITPWTIKSSDLIEKEFVSKNNHILNDHLETAKRAKHTGVHEFAEVFYKHVGSSEYWEIYTALKEIVYLQNYLELKKVPYLFVCADNSILYNHTIDHADEYIKSLYKQINKTNWFWFPEGIKGNETKTPRGFYQWALENKYPIGTTHPLEQAHADAAKLIREKFNDMVKKHLE